MKPWYWTATGVAAMVYLAWHGGYEQAGWWVASVVMGLFGFMTWVVERQQETIRTLLQSMLHGDDLREQRAELHDEQLGVIADMAGVGPTWRARRAIAIARVQAKREKGVAHG